MASIMKESVVPVQKYVATDGGVAKLSITYNSSNEVWFRFDIRNEAFLAINWLEDDHYQGPFPSGKHTVTIEREIPAKGTYGDVRAFAAQVVYSFGGYGRGALLWRESKVFWYETAAPPQEKFRLVDVAPVEQLVRAGEDAQMNVTWQNDTDGTVTVGLRLDLWPSGLRTPYEGGDGQFTVCSCPPNTETTSLITCHIPENWAAMTVKARVRAQVPGKAEYTAWPAAGWAETYTVRGSPVTPPPPEPPPTPPDDDGTNGDGGNGGGNGGQDGGGGEPSATSWLSTYWWALLLAVLVLGAAVYVTVRYWPRGGR